jgi:hypothetical protein
MQDLSRTRPSELATVAGQAVVGWIIDWPQGGAPRVSFEENVAEPVTARTIVERPSVVVPGREVLLLFERGDPTRPIVVGLLQQGCAEGELPTGTPVEAHVDGNRVEIEGNDEIVLRCGKAAIVLRRNGRVMIHGTYVETRAKGTNRIKGGWVLIN